MTSPTRTPVHTEAEVLSARKVGAYHHLSLVAPGVPERFRPGNFVAASVGAPHLARRALWIHRVRSTGAYGPTIDVVVDPVGPGTRWLASRTQGSRLEVTGPLGRPFASPRDPVPCLLVGEEYAAAPLFPLAERLRERGCQVTMLLAAATESRLLAALEARRSVRAVTVVTGDGSVGRRATLAEVVDDEVARNAPAVVYAAGRRASLHAVAAAAEAHGAWSQVALERPTPCGTGLCHGCPVPVVAEHGAPRTVRSCHEGPVFRGDRVRWDHLEVGP